MSCDLVAAQDVGGILVAAAGKKKTAVDWPAFP